MFIWMSMPFLFSLLWAVVKLGDNTKGRGVWGNINEDRWISRPLYMS